VASDKHVIWLEGVFAWRPGLKAPVLIAAWEASIQRAQSAAFRYCEAILYLLYRPVEGPECVHVQIHANLNDFC